jgi:hypothetical protein
MVLVRRYIHMRSTSECAGLSLSQLRMIWQAVAALLHGTLTLACILTAYIVVNVVVVHCDNTIKVHAADICEAQSVLP